MDTHESSASSKSSPSSSSTQSPEFARVRERRDGAHVLILAGGDGTRLRAVTRVLTGDDRPKQFCALVGPEPLLVETERRAAQIAPPDRTLILLTRAHEPYFRPLVATINPSSLVIQPQNRGTAAAVLYGLLRIAARTPTAPVVILPSDHWVSDDSAFLLHVHSAIGIVEAHEGSIVLLGTTPTRPEPEYGWIEPAELIVGSWRELHRVARFVEKPSPAEAAALYLDGTRLWNTSVVVGQVEELLFLFALAKPDLVDAFLTIWPTLGSLRERAAAEGLYATLAASDFSRDVLARHPKALAVLAVTGVLWEDLGRPARIREARRLLELRGGKTPSPAARLHPGYA